MSLELPPELKVLIDKFQSLLVVLWESNLFPQLIWQMCSFNGFHVEIAVALVLEHGCVSAVSQWTRVLVTQTSQVVLIGAEVLGYSLSFKTTVSCVDDSPHNVVLYHI